MAGSLAEAVAEAELAFVCGPVDSLPGLVGETLAACPEGCAVSDVGSTKRRLVEALGAEPRFVGGHPVCGSEARGIANARVDLFDGATWFLTPGPAPIRRTSAPCTRSWPGSAPGRWRSTPRRTTGWSRITSHLPHAIANMLANQAGAGRVDGHDPLTASGGSFRDMTRVAGANPRIWVDIFLDNRDALLDGLREHGRGDRRR